MAIDMKQIKNGIKAKDIVRGVFINYTPVIVNTFDSGKEVINDVRKIGKQIKSSMRQSSNNVDSSSSGKKAIALFTAARDAIRSGSYELDEINDEMYDDYEDYDNNFSTASLTEEERAEMAPEDVILRGNRGVAQSVIRASSAQLQGMGKISGRMLSGTLRGMEASTKSINATILYGTNMLASQMGSVNNKLDIINQNLVNLIEYQNKNTTLYYEKNLEMMDQMLASMSNFNTMNQGRSARDLKNFNVTSGFNFKDYLERLKKGIKGSAAVSGGGMLLSFAKQSLEMPEITSLGEMLGSSILPLALDNLPKINKKFNKIRSVDKLVTRYLEENLYNIGDKLSKNWLPALLGLDSLGNTRRNATGVNTGMYMKDQIPWNGKAQKALTEVIPELLTSIDAGINKNDKRYYNYDNGAWMDRKSVEREYTDYINNLITFGLSDTINKIGNRLDNSGKSEQEISDIKKRISNISNDLVYNAGDSAKNKQSLVDSLQDAGLSINEFNQIFNEVFIGINEIQERIAEFNAQVGSTDSVYRNVNNKSGSTADKAIGKTAFQNTKENRYSHDVFGMYFSKDLQSLIDYIQTQMLEIDPDFKMTKEIREGILLAAKSGASDEEVLRQVKNTYGKSHLMNKIKEMSSKTWAKIRRKEYVKPYIKAETVNFEDYGKYGNELNTKILEKTYGVKTHYINHKDPEDTTAPGAASSRMTEETGEVAGAGTTSETKTRSKGKSSVKSPTKDRNLKNRVLNNATQKFNTILSFNTNKLDDIEKDNASAAAVVNDLANEAPSDIGGSIKNLVDSTVISMGAMMSSFTSFGSRLFGKDGMVRNLFESDSFKKTLTDIKNKILYDDEGKIKEPFQKAKDYANDVLNDTKIKLKNTYDYAYDSYAKSKYGEDYKDNDQWKNSKLMQALDWKSKRDDKLNSVEEIENPNETLKASVEQIAETGAEASLALKESTEAFTETVVGTESKEELKKSFTQEYNKSIRKVLPKIGAGAAIGAGIGFLNGAGGHSLLGSLFLPTGLFGGAIVGGGLTLLSQTEAFKSLMFGKIGEDGERSGGIISKELKEKFKKATPIAVGGAFAGVLKSIITAPLGGGKGLGILGMQLLPGGILGGAIIGMGIGLLKNSESFKSMLFGKKGEDGKRTGTWLSKSFNSIKEKMTGEHPGLKNMVKGGALGTVTGAVLSAMGVIPAALSLGGPIGMGIAGLGVGIASSTNRFNQWLFGTEEFDNNGKSLGRKGGILERVKNILMVNVVEPIGIQFKSAALDMVDWAKDKITLPFRTAFGPILDSISGIKDNVTDFVKSKFEDIGMGIKTILEKTVHTLFSPVTKLIGVIGKTLIGGAKVGLQAMAMPITGALGAVNFLTMGKRRSEYIKFYKNYYREGGMKEGLHKLWDAKQADYDQEAKEYNEEAKKNGKPLKAAKKVTFWDRMSDRIGALTGRGEFADAAREAYNMEMESGGKNHFDWRSVPAERRQLNQDRKNRHKAENVWIKANKLSQNIANKDLKGRKMNLTPRMYDYYRKKYVSMGIDPDMIQNNDDLMQLIYDPSKFRARAAGDSGRDGMLQALKNFKLPPEELAQMEHTEKYQEHTTKALDDIRAKFTDIADKVLFDSALTSYREDRNYDVKKLKRNAKKLYKTSLFDGKDKINFNDPELEGYDLHGLKYSDLEDYILGDFGEKSDFKGWLEANGRKYAADDYRSYFTDPEARHSEYAKRFKTSKTSNTVSAPINAGKTSEQIIPDGDSTQSAQLALPPGNSKNESTADKLVDAITEQTEIAKTQAEINAGGSKNFKNLRRKAKRNAIDKKTANNQGVSGIFGNLFNRKKKDEERNAAKLKEEKESKDAQALGDEEESTDVSSNNVNITVDGADPTNNGSIFSKILGTIGSGLSWFGNTKVGRILTNGVKLFGKVGLVAGFGLTLAELVNPGLSDSIGASISSWNDEMEESVEEGTLFEKITGRVVGTIDAFGTWMSEKVLSKDGYLVKGVTKVIDFLPTVMDKFVIPGITRTAEFVTNNAEFLVNTAATVVEAIAPPLIEAAIEIIPKVLSTMGSALWNRFTGKTPKESGDKNLNTEEANKAKSSGKHVGTTTETVTAEEAEEYYEKGYNVIENANGTYSVEKNYTLDSNVFIDKYGNERTVGNESQAKRVRSVGTKLGTQLLSKNFTAAGKLAKTVAGAGLATVGGAAGATLGAVGGIGGAAGGAKIGSKLGTKLLKKSDATKPSKMSKIVSFFKKSGSNAAEDAAEDAVFKATKEAIEEVSTTAGAKLAEEAVGETAEEVMSSAIENITKAVTNSAGTYIDTVGDSVIKEVTENITNISHYCDNIVSNSAVQKAMKDGASEVAEATAKKGLKATFKQVAEWLGKAMLEVAKRSKVGNAIISVIIGNSAKTTTKTALAVGTAGLFEIGSIAIGGLLGGIDTKSIANLFEVSQNMVDGKMRVISALLGAIYGSTIGSYIQIGLIIAELITGFDVNKWIAAKLYTLFNSEKSSAKLKTGQDTLAVETALYNQENGTNLTVSEYNDMANKSFGSRVIGFFKGTNVNTKEYANRAQEIVSSGTYSIDNSGNVTLPASGMTKSTQKYYFTSKSNNLVGYGPGQSQSNSAWANMPIGRFANGEISTMKTGGCGPTALSTIANMYGPGINPGSVGAYAAANGYITDGGANADLFTKGAAGLGLKGTKVGKSEVSTALASGHPMAISGKNSGPFTKNGHVVVANGISGNKIRIIDPMDGSTKLYDKNSITSGMTNAWAYGKTVGYGKTSSTETTSSGTSSALKLKILNGIGIAQTTLANIPVIMQGTMSAIFNAIPNAITTPLTIPISYAVKALGTISKLLNGEDLDSEDYSIVTDTASILNKVSSSVASAMKSVGASTTNIDSAEKLINNTKSLGVTNIFRSIVNSAKSKVLKNAGYGSGPVGFDGASISGLSSTDKATLTKYANEYLTASKAYDDNYENWRMFDDIQNDEKYKSAKNAASNSYYRYGQGLGISTSDLTKYINQLKTSSTTTTKTELTNAEKTALAARMVVNDGSRAAKMANELTSIYNTTLKNHNVYESATTPQDIANSLLLNQAAVLSDTEWATTASHAITFNKLNAPISGITYDDAFNSAKELVNNQKSKVSISSSTAAELAGKDPTVKRATAYANTDQEYRKYLTGTEDYSLNDEYNAYLAESSSSSTDFLTELKNAWATAPTSLGGFLGGLTKLGNVLKALLGTFKGEGSFTDLYNMYASGKNSLEELEESISNNAEISSAGSISASDEQSKIWNWLTSHGFNKYGAAGVMGCFDQESNNTAKTIEGYYLSKFPGYDTVLASNSALDSYTTDVLFPAYAKSNISINKNGYKATDGHYYPGFGYAQWTGDRAYQLLKYSNKYNQNWATPDAQLRYLGHELSEKYTSTSINTKNAKSIEDATATFFGGFEAGNPKASTLYPEKYQNRLNAAKKYYNKFANMKSNDTTTATDDINTANSGYGSGPVGFGPDDDNSVYTSWGEFNNSANSALQYLYANLDAMGLKDYLFTTNNDSNKDDNTVTGTTDAITYSVSGSGGMRPVSAMQSILGKIKYTLGSPQDPDKGWGSCASTVAWAYKKGIGIRPGDTVSSTAYAGATSQAKDKRFTTIWKNDGSGLTDADIAQFQPGDIVYQNWDITKPNGTHKHAEMYVGNGLTLSHGGPNTGDLGPVYQDLTTTKRRAHTMLVRRYNGFMSNSGITGTDDINTANSGYGVGPTKRYNAIKIDNDLERAIKNYSKPKSGEKEDLDPRGASPHEGNMKVINNNTTVDTTNVTDRLDKILTVIGEWYLDNKNNSNNQSNTTNNTFVNNTNTVNNTSTKSSATKTVNSNIDKLVKKQKTYSQMYK